MKGSEEGDKAELGSHLKNVGVRKISEEHLRTILDPNFFGISVSTPEGAIIYVSPATAKLFGFDSEEEFAGVPAADHWSSPKEREQFIGLLKKDPVKDFAAKLRRKNGSVFWCSVSAKMVATKTGSQLVVALQDITERKQMEEKLKDYTQNLEKVVEERTQQAQARMRELQERDETIRKLSTPLIEVAEGVVLLPVVGVLDSARAKQLTESVLERIARAEVDVIVTDVSGIAAIDTKTADYLLRTIGAVRLMGSEAVITGIRPDVAVTLVTLGIDLSGIVTRSTLREGLEYAYEELGLKLVKSSQR